MRLDPQNRNLDSDEVFMIKQGFFNAWVCAPKSMSQEEVQEAVSSQFYSGTSAGWVVEPDPDNEDEELKSPGLCHEDCNRQHWNCVC
jgi:hypothetical protein